MTRCLFFVVFLLCLGPWAPRQALAQDFAAAGQHFAVAQDAFQAGQYKRAAEEYQAAYDITRDGGLLFNIGESWQRAGDAQKALTAYRAYIKDQPEGADRPEAEKRVQALEEALKTASGSANPPTAGQQNASGPANPPTSGPQNASGFANSPASGPQNASGSANSPASGPQNASGSANSPASGQQNASGSAPKPGGAKLRTAAWISVAAAVALATAGAILGLGAQNRADELQRRTTVLVSNQPPIYDENQRDAYETLTSEGNAYNTASIALLSVAGAATVTAAALFITDWVKRPKGGPKGDPKGEKSRFSGQPLPSLAIGAGSAVFSVGGSF